MCCVWCVVFCVCTCGCCVVVWVVWLCGVVVVLACCREHVVVLVVRVCVCGVWCGVRVVWCVWLLVCGCVWCSVWCVCVCVWFGVCVKLHTEACWLLYFVLFLLLLFSSLLSSFLLLSSLLSSFLFPSRQQTLYKTRINQHGVQLRGVIWRELHSTSFSARHVVTACDDSSILSSPSPPPPPPPLPTRKRELFITGIFPATN